MRQPPNPEWLPYVKVAFGFALLLLLAILAMVIALGNVEQKTSFGLQQILSALSVLAGMWSQWAFNDKGKP